jgi:DNA-binding transcriptional MocR family regulator
MSDSKLNSDLPPFAMVPRWIIQHTGLTSGAVRVFACLADMAGRDRPAWPSHRTLAIKCNMSVSSVRRHIKELVYAGALTVEPRYKPNQEGQTSNIYTVVNKPVNNTNRSVTKNKGVATSEQPPYPLIDNRTITTEQEPLTKEVDQKEQIKQARKKLAK